MELKRDLHRVGSAAGGLLIVPYGIETKKPRVAASGCILLIVSIRRNAPFTL